MNTKIVMINASPRIEKNSNTDKIIEAFGQGLLQGGCSFTKYAISNRDAWEEIRQAYIQVIDRTQHMKTYARWIYGLHPTDEMIRSYLDSGAMYLLLDGTDIAGMMAVTMSQGNDYHEIAWERQLSDTEVAVVHILAVMPEYQKQGLGIPQENRC